MSAYKLNAYCRVLMFSLQRYWGPTISHSPCSYAGVSCATGRSGTFTINLSGQTVLGMPTELLLLPPELCALLSRVHAGNLSASWANLTSFQTSLRALNLSQNALAGSLPPEWAGSFKALRALDLSLNALNSTLPSAWGAAGLGISLTVLALGANVLSVRCSTLLHRAAAFRPSRLKCAAAGAGLVAAKLGQPAGLQQPHPAGLELQQPDLKHPASLGASECQRAGSQQPEHATAPWQQPGWEPSCGVGRCVSLPACCPWCSSRCFISMPPSPGLTGPSQQAAGAGLTHS